MTYTSNNSLPKVNLGMEFCPHSELDQGYAIYFRSKSPASEAVFGQCRPIILNHWTQH
ncbi:hypothetical protein KSS87_005534 [Heliosperma pusillum]|nr:hypothetical protein KSS87_005534 [Heliosperma pusillum]